MQLERTQTIWFEGPVIPLSDSQQAEDYPQDMAGSVNIASDAKAGSRGWRVWTAQGAVPSRPFIIGRLPEIVEDEIDGEPIPVPVVLPLTVNGRIFPREDVDIWSFQASAGQTITCSVLTTRLGSPFDARLEIRDRNGSRLAESAEETPPGSDALVRFTAPADDTYLVHIHDVKFSGLQHYVYRLTITPGPTVDRVYPLGGRRGTDTRYELSGSNLPADPVLISLPAEAPARFSTRINLPENSSNVFTLALDDLPEFLEQEPNDASAQTQPVEVPAVLNGRIEKPGDVDVWAFHVSKDETLEFDAQAARLGSPLDSVLVLIDAAGKELARADDIGGNQSDSFLRYTFQTGGTVFIRVEERHSSRGGKPFAYRLRVSGPEAPDFRLRLSTDALSVIRGGEAKLKLRVERQGAFAEPVSLEFSGLPPGVTVANPLVPVNAAELELIFKADVTAIATGRPVIIRGTTMIAGKPVVRQATFVAQGAGDLAVDSLLVAVCLPTPYKIKGVYEVKYAQRGGKFVRHFTIDRGGFAGPLTVHLADKQMRHLQGVSGPTIEVPPGATEFDYPVRLPPWMEIGRTSRSVVMVVGEVADADGRHHKVSFTSLNQNEQIVALVDPGQLSLETDRRSLRETPGAATAISVKVGRGQGVNVPVRIELVVPAHIHGVTAEALILAPDQALGKMTLNFSADHPGPFNMPLVLRATAMKGENDTVVAETKIEVVATK